MFRPNEKHKLFGVDLRIFVLGIARMADAIGNSFLIVILPLYIASGNVQGNFFGLNLKESMVTGIVIGIFGLFSSLFQPISGRLSDKAGKRRFFVIIGLLVFTLANLAFLWADNYFVLVIIRMFQGLAAALTITASLALVSELSKVDSRGGNMGIYNTFRMIGFGIGPLASGIMLEGGPYTLPLLGEISGFEAAFYIAAGASLLSTILVLLFIQDPENIEPNTDKLAVKFLSKSKDYILDPIFTLGLTTFIMSSGFALLTAIEPIVNERLNQGASLFAIEFSMLIVSMALVQSLVGFASDKFGRKVFVVSGLIALVPITLLEGLVTLPWQMITLRTVQGLAAASVFAPALALAGDLAAKGQSGAQLSVLTVSFGLGISFGAFLSGYSIRFGFITPFAICAALAGIGAFLVISQVPSINADGDRV